ncbi:MAG: hypothetical protein ACKVP0_03275, partial [Pirellulaceae bacterium]
RPRLCVGVVSESTPQHVHAKPWACHPVVDDPRDKANMHLKLRDTFAFLSLCTLASLLPAGEPTVDNSTDKASLRKSFLGETPPEIVSEKSHWLGPPPYTKLEQLHGNVVWLQFNF